VGVTPAPSGLYADAVLSNNSSNMYAETYNNNNNNNNKKKNTNFNNNINFNNNNNNNHMYVETCSNNINTNSGNQNANSATTGMSVQTTLGHGARDDSSDKTSMYNDMYNPSNHLCNSNKGSNTSGEMCVETYTSAIPAGCGDAGVYNNMFYVEGKPVSSCAVSCMDGPAATSTSGPSVLQASTSTSLPTSLIHSPLPQSRQACLRSDLTTATTSLMAAVAAEKTSTATTASPNESVPTAAMVMAMAEMPAQLVAPHATVAAVAAAAAAVAADDNVLPTATVSQCSTAQPQLQTQAIRKPSSTMSGPSSVDFSTWPSAVFTIM